MNVFSTVTFKKVCALTMAASLMVTLVGCGDAEIDNDEDGLNPDDYDVYLEIEAQGREFIVAGEEDDNPTITVEEGDEIGVDFCVIDGNHDFVIDELDVASSELIDACESIEFTADEAGEFEYYCSVGNHRANGMYGAFVVE